MARARVQLCKILLNETLYFFSSLDPKKQTTLFIERFSTNPVAFWAGSSSSLKLFRACDFYREIKMAARFSSLKNYAE